MLADTLAAMTLPQAGGAQVGKDVQIHWKGFLGCPELDMITLGDDVYLGMVHNGFLRVISCVDKGGSRQVSNRPLVSSRNYILLVLLSFSKKLHSNFLRSLDEAGRSILTSSLLPV